MGCADPHGRSAGASASKALYTASPSSCCLAVSCVAVSIKAAGCAAMDQCLVP